jgi:hypothetical protein
MLDAEITARDILDLTNADKLRALCERLGYPAAPKIAQTPGNLNITDPTLVRAIQRVEKLALRKGSNEGEDVEVWLFELARTGSQLMRQIASAFRLLPGHFLLVFTVDYESFDLALLEIVLPLAESNRQRTVRPWIVTLDRRKVSRVALRVLRRVTFTEEDGSAQHEKMLAAFHSADWSREWFHNHNLFADHYIESRLALRGTDLERAAALQSLKALFVDARSVLAGRIEQTARDHLLVPALKRLGFGLGEGKGAADPRRDNPDYWLLDAAGARVGFCLTYPYARSLDGIDEIRDTQTAEEDPVAVAVHLLKDDATKVTWGIVTNGKHWRLYSRRAESIAASYFEVDLEEILASSDGADGFKYFWTLFHRDAFVGARAKVDGAEVVRAPLDEHFDDSRKFAQELERDLKKRVYQRVFPAFAGGFIQSIRAKEGKKADLSDARLREVFEGTLTLLYRVLFVLYAEARDLLPVREVRGYHACSITRMRDEIAEAAGLQEDKVDARLAARWNTQGTALYDRLLDLAKTIAEGDASRNVPLYNGGLFVTSPTADDDSAEARNARFLSAWRVNDLALAKGLDALTRAIDEKTHGLANLDYRGLGVRQLGSIYEGLLEHRLVVEGDTVTLDSSDDKRHATGSYYTAEHLVRFVVERTLGPVMRAHLRQMAARFEDARQKRVDPATLADEFFDLTVVDPAMGSGHFLVTAIDWITDELVDFLADHPRSALQSELARTRATILAELEKQGVSIDAQQLTDLALLRRFILKRCIFGVDLNPMAVELAKVSVWLHCFTLGAPLSLLDHHLRCGNSLAGVTVDDVREASSVRQQSLFDQDNFGSLQKATENMNEVVRMPDLTPSQAKSSRAAYQKALVELRALKRLLDVYCAHYIIAVKTPELVNDHHPVAAFISTSTAAKMALAKDPRAALTKADPATRKRVTEALDLAEAHRFFHWELEFPEVFYRAKRRAKVRGFDAVIGNPPWIRQEDLKALKGLFAVVHKHVYDPVADLYVSFIGRARSVLRGGGHLGMVLPNKWFRADYAERLRETLASPKHFHPRVVVDFGHAPKLFEADTFPCVLVAERAGGVTAGGVAEAVPLVFCRVERKAHGSQAFAGWFEERRVDVLSKRLRRNGWELLHETEGELMDHLRNAGVALKEYVGAAPLYGVKPGYDKAFTVGQGARDELVEADPNAKKILRKFLRGENMDRWRGAWGGEWMIALASSENVDWPWSEMNDERKAEACFKKSYPSVHKWMKGHEAALRKRGDQGKFWWELRSCAYYERFDEPKLMYMDIAFGSGFAFDSDGLYSNNTCYFIPGDHKVVLACLNSAVGWWYFWRAASHAKDEALRMHTTYVEQFPVPKVPTAKRKVITGVVDRMLAMTDRQREGEVAFAKFLAKRTGIAKRSDKMKCFWKLDGDGFLDEVRKAKGKVPTGEGRTALLVEFEKHRTELREVRADVCKLEVALQWHVCALYGLSAEEIALMRRTAPPRDPWALIEAEAREGGYPLV